MMADIQKLLEGMDPAQALPEIAESIEKNPASGHG